MADFDYTIPVPAEDPECESSFQRTFEHQDWVDGQDVVQAQRTENEMGFNERLHRIETDLDQLGHNLNTAFECIARLRQQLVQVLDEIKQEFNRPPDKTSKESKDTKDFKDVKDAKDGKDSKEFKDVKDNKDTKDAKDGKDSKDSKDGKDSKDSKDNKDNKDSKDFKDSDGGGKVVHEQIASMEPRFDSMESFLFGTESPAAATEPVGRSFIRPDERPAVGQRALEVAEESAPR